MTARAANRPGLPAIEYRAGTHSSFLADLLAGLSEGDRLQLRRLTTREPEDATIAFLDAVATVADVLTFYQERIANESYLRTATERRSVLELARAIGYELGAGVAAETALAFTLETAPGSPASALLDAGTRVQSVPGPGERPQTFETVAAVEARPEWNELRPRMTEPDPPRVGQTDAYVAGVETNLRPGDAILVVGDERLEGSGNERWDFRFVEAVDPDHERGVTRVSWELGLGSTDPEVEPATRNPRMYALRKRATLFGAVAPDWRLLTAEVRNRYGDDTSNEAEWPGLSISAIAGTDGVIHLDGLHREILAGSWLVIARRGYEELYGALEVDESARKGFGLAGKTTRVELDGEHLHFFEHNVRDAVVYAQSEPLELVERPVTADVDGDEIDLDREIPPLDAGRLVIVTGVPPGETEAASEVAAVEAVEGATLRLDAAVGPYLRGSVRIAANVAPATHGEGVAEPLGSGEAAKALQRFALRQSPVTHVYADTPTGRRSTLDVRVDGVLWEEVPALFGHGPRDRVYTLRIDDEANAAVQFGDGRTGARLPTGRENVHAAYRKGLGREGNVGAGALTLLLTRPLGLRGVTNPLPATGGADPEVLADARANAPLTVLTLGRIVSLADHADFARAFAGVAKAHATWVWGSDGRGVFLTVAGTDGVAVPDGGPTQRALVEAMGKARDPHVPLVVRSYEPVAFRLAATIAADPLLLPEDVLAGAEAALSAHFSFTARAFGQPVPLSEVLAVLHGARGVLSVDVDSLYTGALPALNQRLDALVPVAGEDAGAALPAQLLTLDLRPGDLRVAA